MSVPQDTDPNKLSNTFRDRPLADHGRHWDGLWRESFTPWDRGGPSAALADVLAERPELFPEAEAGGRRRRRTALVPGCGTGHDALLLAALGYDAYGLDYSPEATRRAVEHERAQAEAGDDADVYRLVPRETEKGTVTWLTGDFFADDFLRQAGVDKFDLIFDYTFFCALPPSARPSWAKRMAQLLNPGGGRLVCLQWPSRKPPTEQGPPWGVTPELYLAHLSRPGEEVPYDAEGNPVSVEAGREGLKRLALIVPRRTHKTGTDESGVAHDRVSVWSH